MRSLLQEPWSKAARRVFVLPRNHTAWEASHVPTNTAWPAELLRGLAGVRGQRGSLQGVVGLPPTLPALWGKEERRRSRKAPPPAHGLHPLHSPSLLEQAFHEGQQGQPSGRLTRLTTLGPTLGWWAECPQPQPAHPSVADGPARSRPRQVPGGEHSQWSTSLPQGLTGLKSHAPPQWLVVLLLLPGGRGEPAKVFYPGPLRPDPPHQRAALDTASTSHLRAAWAGLARLRTDFPRQLGWCCGRNPTFWRCPSPTCSSPLGPWQKLHFPATWLSREVSRVGRQGLREVIPSPLPALF